MRTAACSSKKLSPFSLLLQTGSVQTGSVQTSSVQTSSGDPRSSLKASVSPLRRLYAPIVPSHEEDGSRVYVNGSIMLNDLALGKRLFADVYAARAAVNGLLSMDEWRKLQQITELDLSECQLVYVELAAIISMYIKNAFGDISNAIKTLIQTSMGAVAPTILQHWVTGCLLYRSGICTRKLSNFCLDILKHVPGQPLWLLECTRKVVKNKKVRQRKPLPQGRPRFLAFTEELAVTITAPSFAKLACARPAVIENYCHVRKNISSPGTNPLSSSTSPRGSNIKPTGSNIKPTGSNIKPTGSNIKPTGSNIKPTGSNIKPTGSNIKPTGSDSTKVYQPTEGFFTPFGTGVLNALSGRSFRDESAECSILTKMNQLFACHVEKLSGEFEAKDLEACSLDYFELASIIERHIEGAFGTVSDCQLRMVATALGYRRRSVLIRSWVSGCILQYVKASIQDLITFCTDQLKYKPPTDRRRTLLCLRNRFEPVSLYLQRPCTFPKQMLTEMLIGLDRKLSFAQLQNLTTATIEQQRQYLAHVAAARRLIDRKSNALDDVSPLDLAPQRPPARHDLVPAGPPASHHPVPVGSPASHDLAPWGPPASHSLAASHDLAPWGPPTSHGLAPWGPLAPDGLAPWGPAASSGLAPVGPPASHAPWGPATSGDLAPRGPAPGHPAPRGPAPGGLAPWGPQVVDDFSPWGPQVVDDFGPWDPPAPKKQRAGELT
ncbi:putative DNA-directed RNA polymerase [Gregarina niphandrodes]|uniref:DNA-directed RNA polymerase n=1 Tax=Gregarina niphandrodes TaxID=110365 RepID=A0A023B755_GRENI|nr:putative DNA-directed RNA polymerase [Gregarina niphandrodes]EZG66996.1 putative DNA-directed RNA polymerase [Gregarina niphandrodes]|eukprot:XP_011130383.1 putative DNA-directed RNA polymerase [Gregarina niphandrodes]